MEFKYRRLLNSQGQMLKPQMYQIKYSLQLDSSICSSHQLFTPGCTTGGLWLTGNCLKSLLLLFCFTYITEKNISKSWIVFKFKRSARLCTWNQPQTQSHGSREHLKKTFRRNYDIQNKCNRVTVFWLLWLTLIEVSYVVLFQQRTNELQLRVDVLVDVRGPLVTLMEPAEEMHSRLQQHRHPGAAERFTREQITGHASHLQVTECYLWRKQRYGFITLKITAVTRVKPWKNQADQFNLSDWEGFVGPIGNYSCNPQLYVFPLRPKIIINKSN